MSVGGTCGFLLLNRICDAKVMAGHSLDEIICVANAAPMIMFHYIRLLSLKTGKRNSSTGLEEASCCHIKLPVKGVT